MTETEVIGMKEDNRLICKCREARIYARNDIRDSAVCFIFFRCLKSNLDEDDLLLVLRVFLEKRLKCQKFMAYTLNRSMSNH